MDLIKKKMVLLPIRCEVNSKWTLHDSVLFFLQTTYPCAGYGLVITKTLFRSDQALGPLPSTGHV